MQRKHDSENSRQPPAINTKYMLRFAFSGLSSGAALSPEETDVVARSSKVRNWLLALLLTTPCALYGQMVQVPLNQCVYRLGDNPAWAATHIDLHGWKPYTEYRMTGDAYLLWVRCHAAFDTNGMLRPAVFIRFDGVERIRVFIDGQPASPSGSSRIYAVPPGSARLVHTVAVRVSQGPLTPGLLPGRPVYLNFGDASDLLNHVQTMRANALTGFVPAYSSYLIIGAAGLFLLGLFLFDRSQKAAFWLGIYCCAVCLTRLNFMFGSFLFGEHYPFFIGSVFFAFSVLESWALVRVSFALAQKRVPAIYWVVFAAWVFLSVGTILSAILPVRWALPLSLFVQTTSFKPIWLIWGFACTAPFVAFWPWNRLRGRLYYVSTLCGVWAAIDGWFQLQQVIFDRNTWSNSVQNWVSLATAALVIGILGYIFREQRITADERAEMRGELTAARQVQHLLVPDKMQVVPGVSVSSAYLPAHEVGGDFYLSRALPNGTQRVLLGDVSGKGVPAALTSALLLGAADRCDDLRPPAVLKELNAALHNSSIGGFTTCLCADLLPGGVILIANAGQLPPYRNGCEIELPADLPLGIDPSAEYAESSLQLAPGDTLTFLSDGVVEARNTVGELFGFERTRQISGHTAQQIAEAAVAFGQHDDITVLTLSLARVPATA